MPKKSLFLLFLCVFAFQVVAQVPKLILHEEQTKVKQVAPKRQKGCGYTFPLRVGSFPANPPFAWLKEEQKNAQALYVPEGAIINLMREIAQKTQMQTEFVGFTSYEKALQALVAGQIDILAGLYYAPDLTGSSVKIIAPAFFTTSVMAWTLPHKNITIKTLDDLAKYKGVVRQEEMIYPVLFKNLPKEADIQIVNGSEKAFQMLLQGQCDYILGGLHNITTEKNRLKLGEHIVHNGKILKQFGLFMAISGVSPCLKEQKKLSQTLKQIFKEQPFDSFLVDGDNMWRAYFQDDNTFATSMGLSTEETTEEIDFPIMNIDLSSPENQTRLEK